MHIEFFWDLNAFFIFGPRKLPANCWIPRPHIADADTDLRGHETKKFSNRKKIWKKKKIILYLQYSLFKSNFVLGLKIYTNKGCPTNFFFSVFRHTLNKIMNDTSKKYYNLIYSSKYFRAILRFKEIKGGQDHYRTTNHKRIQ